MEAVCARRDTACVMHALSAVLHSLHLYCATVAAAIMCCYAPTHKQYQCTKQWRGQNIRGLASLALCVTWCCGAASALLRPTDTVHLVSALMAPLAWLAAAAFHVAIWTRHSSAPILYLAIYWALTTISAMSILRQYLLLGATVNHVEIYIQSASMLLSLIVSVVDCICFYDEVTKRSECNLKSTTEIRNVAYKHNNTHFYSKVCFYWINSFLYKGYISPLELDDLGELPDDERSTKYYKEFKNIYKKQENSYDNKENTNIWMSFVRKIWPNFYIAGVLKLFSDLIAVIPPLGLGVIINFIENPTRSDTIESQVTIQEFLTNGYVMLCVVTLALISQALLSQNSTHLVTVEGTRLKTALQAMIYDKCMRLAPWSSADMETDEETPLLKSSEDLTTTRSGVLTNLVSQDTYNVMSCVWICHYIWAIPLKVVVILYLLYTKLGLSAIIGTAVSVSIITPLQFYIGKKLSDNSKDIAKCTDHRISKMYEILQGMNVIKLYVWEDLFKEKILQLREVELKLLNKDSMYWSFLTFSTQISTVIITAVTFIVYYFIEDENGLTAVNVFAGLAFFNQLTVPLLILPVTVLMVIQAMVSTKRIRDFLELPESNNVLEVSDEETKKTFDSVEQLGDNPLDDDVFVAEFNDQFSADGFIPQSYEYLVRFRNASFTWGTKNDSLEIDDLDIPIGKLIMVVGGTSSGKSSFISAVLGEMYLERGDVNYNRGCSTWYAGQPPWLLERSVRENIVMGSSWCQRRYERVLRATALNPDLQLLPEGDSTRLGSHGTPLSGGQRVRVCVARALYSNARLIALDEPLGALDATLARHMVARGLVPATRAGHTIILATNRLELLHYADLVIAMDDGRVSGVGRATSSNGTSTLSRWAQLAAEARASAARLGAGPVDGTTRERSRLVRALSRAKFQSCSSEDNVVGISEAAGAHLLAEVPMCAGGTWRRAKHQRRSSLSRQLSSPPPSSMSNKFRREVRRAVSADESNTTLQREASLLRRLLRPRTHRTLTRWTPRSLRRLISSDSDNPPLENNGPNGAGNVEDSTLETTYTSLTSNGVETGVGVITDASPVKHESDGIINEWSIWCEYGRACGAWGIMYWAAAATTQALALAADYWLTYTTTQTLQTSPNENQTWNSVRTYAALCLGSACAAGFAQACCACAGARARRALHERLLHATLHAPLHHYNTTPAGAMLHRFSSDILVIDKKLPTAVTRWAQLALLCAAAMLVNAIAAPWTLLALLPTFLIYLLLQAVYLSNARELQSSEGGTAASVLSLCSETCAGGSTIRAGRLQERMRADFMQRLDSNHNTLLLINVANRWLGLTLDLVGAGCVCISLSIAVYGGSSGAVAGLSGTYALLLPAYLAHLAKCRADLDQQLAALHRVHTDTNLPQEDYRDDCELPSDWQRNGKIEFEDVSVQHEPTSSQVLDNINISIAPGQKVAVCGRSGSGKSTLLLSCVGATTIKSGRILIDGQDVTRVPLRVLRHRVVVLPQEPIMFSGTLRENLDPLAVHTDEEIWLCLKAVGLYDFVTAQSAGLECTVGKTRGGCSRGWSAGRAARACAARAALRARLATALLLDEPAAALDAPAERALLSAIATHTPTVTVLTVAHRVSSVRDYDHAVVLDEGRTVEQGSVDALLSRPASRLARMLATSRSRRYT